jgi:hypothetical protein
VGSSHIKGVVSALEFHRLRNEYLYSRIDEARVSLRTDCRIRAIEKAVQHNEPNRADKAHILKAAGSSAGRICLLICDVYVECSRCFIAQIPIQKRSLSIAPFTASIHPHLGHRLCLPLHVIGHVCFSQARQLFEETVLGTCSGLTSFWQSCQYMTLDLALLFQ